MKSVINPDLVKAFLPIFIFTALAASAQSNGAARLDAISNSTAQITQNETNHAMALAQRVEEMRAICLQNRRIICGKILKVLPDGLVVDSGYTNLMRAPLNQSWLIPGTVPATRATNLVEGNQPEAICIGLIFPTDLPKSRGAKPKVFDYVNVEGFPMGQYTYT